MTTDLPCRSVATKSNTKKQILVGVAAMARRAGVQRGTIYRWQDKGLPLRRCPGGRLAIDADSFDSWVLGKEVSE
jgi:hypothetical protein